LKEALLSLVASGRVVFPVEIPVVCAYIRKNIGNGVLVLDLDNKSKYLHMI
jgi:hypothetical protein